MEVYTMNKWNTDGEFKAKQFQEVDDKVYEEMFDVMPPYSLNSADEVSLEHQLNTELTEAFCMGEDHTYDADGHPLYLSFGRTSSGKYYYLGLCRAAA